MAAASGVNTDLFTYLAVSAAASVACLVLAQTDLAARKLLDPARVQAKRIQEYTYRWKACLDKAQLQLAYYLAGGIQEYESDPKLIDNGTEYVSKQEDLSLLVNRIVGTKRHDSNKHGTEATATTTSTFRPLKIDSDPDDPSGEYYLYLVEDHQDQKQQRQIFQVPLVSFGRSLQKAFENILTPTTLCFVADASSGKASHLIEQLVQESKSGVAVVSEPLWMVQLAQLVQQRICSTTNCESVLFALCRLDAWRLRHLTKDSRTVLFTLPGQALTPILLPLVQRVFPEDRHVFAYDGCVASVKRAIGAQRSYARGVLPNTINDATSICNNPVRHSTPFLTCASSARSSLAFTLSGLRDALSKLPVAHAQVVETWMSSVDMFFKLKEEETTNGYLPYVFKLSMLTSLSYTFEPQSDSYWSLCSLLQFITGCRSRPLPEGVLDAAAEWLKDYNTTTSQTATVVNVSEVYRKAIENCVFKHKLILIGDKTLQDTVLPTQHWTLKQASRKGGCACCAPEEELEDEEDEEYEKAKGSNGTTASISDPGAFASASKGSFSTTATTPFGGGGGSQSKFVDGKLGFAFDPTQFST